MTFIFLSQKNNFCQFQEKDRKNRLMKNTNKSKISMEKMTKGSTFKYLKIKTTIKAKSKYLINKAFIPSNITLLAVNSLFLR